jgi:hypothetical protein
MACDFERDWRKGSVNQSSWLEKMLASSSPGPYGGVDEGERLVEMVYLRLGLKHEV